MMTFRERVVTMANTQWLDEINMDLVMIVLRNAEDKENLWYKGYHFYQDDNDMCAGWVSNPEGTRIASWNGHRNTFKGTEEDKKVIQELEAMADGYELPDSPLIGASRRKSEHKQVRIGEYTVTVKEDKKFAYKQLILGLLEITILILAIILLMGGV